MRLLLIVLLALSSFGLSKNWYVKPEEGIRKAKEDGRLVMFYFYSKHCPYCEQMQSFIFPEERVAKSMENLVVVSLDIHSDEGHRWAMRFGVFGVPSYVFYDPQTGKAISRGYGSMGSDDFINLIQKACKISGVKRC